jgi:CheY-like chemotaxis protein
MSKLPILVVDDNADSCEMMGRLLSALGYQADVANDGATAIDLAKKHAYGFAIVDYQMPGLNGVELFRKLREIRPEIAGVFLTGHTTIDVVYPAIEAGILRVLSKPADFDELIPLIEQHLMPVA